MSPHPVAAIVLAAGSSARMGQPKQLLPWGATTLLGQALENLRQADLAEIVLVLGAQAEAIDPALPPMANLRTVYNPAYQQGMASSLRAGLGALSPQTEAALIVLADQPLVRAGTLARLASHPTAAHILIPTHRGRRGNPVRLHRALFAQAMALTGDVGCRALFAEYPQALELLEVEDEGILLDLDTMDEYRDEYRKRVPAPPG